VSGRTRLTVRVHAKRLEWDGSTLQLWVRRVLALDLDQLVAFGSLHRLSDRLSASRTEVGSGAAPAIGSRSELMSASTGTCARVA
jgi:hypothetical protein